MLVRITQRSKPRVDERRLPARRVAEMGWLAPMWKLLRRFGRLRRSSGSYTLPSPYPTNLVLSRASHFKSLGLHPREAAAFQALADQHRYEIFVRSGHVSRVANVGRPGVRPKPAGVYQKTNKGRFAAGLVIYPSADLEKAKRDLAAMRDVDAEHATLAARVLAAEGLNVKALGQDVLGVHDRAGNLFYGDIDIHGVYRRGADALAEPIAAHTFVPQFNVRLVATGLHAPGLLKPRTAAVRKDFGVLPHSPIQHGAHDEWVQRNDASYAGGVNMGPLPGVIHFRPEAKPYHIATVGHYRDILTLLGRDTIYTADAWSNGRNRLASARYVRRASLASNDALP